MVRPERLKYVRRLRPPSKCVFCEACGAKKNADKLVVYRGKEAMVVLNKYPYNSGHVLVMPMRHEGELDQLTDSEHAEVSFLVKESVRILKKVYSCKGLNVGLNLGAAAGAGIPDHMHFHVLPRWHGDTNFFPLIAETKLIVETLETTYAKLFLEFEKLRVSAKSSLGSSAKNKSAPKKVGKGLVQKKAKRSSKNK